MKLGSKVARVSCLSMTAARLDYRSGRKQNMDRGHSYRTCIKNEAYGVGRLEDGISPLFLIPKRGVHGKLFRRIL